MSSLSPNCLSPIYGLQELLGSVYATDVAADVRDFLVTDPAVLHDVEDEDARDIPEKLLLAEADDELGVALYLDAALVGRLEAADPRERLDGDNLQDFCTVLEGVSHFHYVAWNAARDRPVSLLELELQAEIDKYVTARCLLDRQRDHERSRPLARGLLGQLFDDPPFDEALDAAQLCRYREAARWAGRFCAALERRYPAAHVAPGMLREVRDVYRLKRAAKVSRIRSRLFS